MKVNRASANELAAPPLATYRPVSYREMSYGNYVRAQAIPALKVVPQQNRPS